MSEQKLAQALRWALDWIDSVPKDAVLPAMPGFDRDYVEGLLSRPAPAPRASTGLKRYEYTLMNPDADCMEHFYEMRQNAEGSWVKFSEVDALLAAPGAVQPSTTRLTEGTPNWQAHKYPFNIGLMGQYDENMSKRYYIASHDKVIAQHIEEEHIGILMGRLSASTADPIPDSQWNDAPIITKHWRVEVSTGGEQIVAIESEMLAGRELSDEDADIIRHCADHLWAFIGPRRPPAPDSQKGGEG